MSSSSFYEGQLIVLSVFCVCSVFLERKASNQKQRSDLANGHDGAVTTTAENGHGGAHNGWRLDNGHAQSAAALARQYLIVYAIVMGADWLQGPYVYSLYREQYGYPERVVATLFVTGFLSAGITAPLVGAWADQHGRKRVCLAFCVTYTLACVCTLSPTLPILFAGRVLGGISTSILFSAFESWLVSSSNALSLPQQALSDIFGRATLVNGFVATAAGILSNRLVGHYDTHTAPFIASGVALVLAWFLIGALWGENYGSGGGSATTDPFQLRRLGHAWKIVRDDPSLLALGFTQTCFEGSMYLFVFAWVPSLQEASAPQETLPLGYIFSAYMVSMMLGSLLYTCIVTYQPYSSTYYISLAAPKSREEQENSLTLHAKLSSLVCTVSAFALAASVSTGDAKYRFWAFCLFEACVGMYYPVQGMLRGALISNEHRATLSALFRVPLNIFVVVSLLTGVSSARLYVVAFCATVLSLSAIVTGVVIVPRAEEASSHSRRP